MGSKIIVVVLSEQDIDMDSTLSHECHQDLVHMYTRSKHIFSNHYHLVPVKRNNNSKILNINSNCADVILVIVGIE